MQAGLTRRNDDLIWIMSSRWGQGYAVCWASKAQTTTHERHSRLKRHAPFELLGVHKFERLLVVFLSGNQFFQWLKLQLYRAATRHSFLTIHGQTLMPMDPALGDARVIVGSLFSPFSIVPFFWRVGPAHTLQSRSDLPEEREVPLPHTYLPTYIPEWRFLFGCPYFRWPRAFRPDHPNDRHHQYRRLATTTTTAPDEISSCLYSRVP